MKFRFLYALAIATIIGFASAVYAQHTVTSAPYMATLQTDLKTVAPGKSVTLDFSIMDASSMAPSEHLHLEAKLSMPSMSGMMLEQPKVTAGEKPGHYKVALTFPHEGDYQLDLTVKSVCGKLTILSFKIAPGGKSDMGDMKEMGGMQMKGALGNWSANREGSGTSWQPDSSPMFMKMLGNAGGFDIGAMGIAQAGYVNAGGRRGDKGFFSNSMVMLMGSKELGGGTLGLNFMTSADPIINGEFGVPNLFQTGETAHGVPLVDRQHPHNIFSELAGSYSHPLGKDWSGFIYGGPVGEPALGDVMFMHRPSGMEIPEAPISHHWFDSTHISFGVITLGTVYANRWKLEGSVFNGHEPGENRYTIGPEGLNSGSGRLSYNPSKDWSFSTSYGYLDSPEALSPGVNEHRLTVSAAYSHNFGADNLSTTAYWGRDIVEGTAAPSDAYLIEGTYYHKQEAFFTRFERVAKDELYNVPAGDYVINKLLFGDVHNFYTGGGLDYGIGAYGGVYSFPGSLVPYYGRNPFTFGVFLRVKPGKM